MQLIAQYREQLGKKNIILRKQRKIPGVIFGKDLESASIALDLLDFKKVFEHAGETELVDLVVGDETSKVLIKELQYDPITLEVIHAGFHKVNLKEKIQANIPVEIVGEENNELVKAKEALVLVILNEITVEALPTDLPNKFIVDVSNLKEIGDGVTVASLDYNKEKVEIVGTEEDETVVKLDYALQEEIAETDVSEGELLEKLTATAETAEVADENTEEASE